MGKLYEQSETGCCPRFNPEPWQEKEITFKDRLFVKDHVRSFLHIPLNFGTIMVKNMEKSKKRMPSPPNHWCSLMTNHSGGAISISL
jgi:hypothetical protein